MFSVWVCVCVCMGKQVKHHCSVGCTIQKLCRRPKMDRALMLFADFPTWKLEFDFHLNSNYTIWYRCLDSSTCQVNRASPAHTHVRQCTLQYPPWQFSLFSWHYQKLGNLGHFPTDSGGILWKMGLVTLNLVAGGQVTELRNQRPLGETSHQRQRHLTPFPATASTTQQQQRKKDWEIKKETLRVNQEETWP